MPIPSPVDYDVAVIGAGPAGSSVAATLAQRNWRVLLVERDRFPRHKVCGEFLSPEAQASLRSLQLYDQLAARQPVALASAEIISRGGARLKTALPAAGWGLSRYTMDTVLASAAQQRGATVWHEATVIDSKDEGPSTVLSVRRGNETTAVRVRAVINAGGRAVSAKLSPHPVKRPPDRLNVGIKAHFSGLSMPNRVEVYLFDGGYVGINAVETGAANVCFLASYAAFADGDHNPQSMFAAIGRQNPAFAARLDGAQILPETVCSVGAVDTGLPSRPWHGFACLGDCATMIPPLCGDGMAMAIHSAVICAPYADAFLRYEIGLVEWEQGYVADWHESFASRLRVGRLLQAMLNSKASDWLLRAGGQLPMIANYFAKATRGAVSSESSAAPLPTDG